jgi:pSer/pThr/pTyr-binding forkhead associated (FHA) protein
MSGAMRPRIVAISGPLERQEFLLGKSDLNIGRGKRNDICLDDPLVSLKHCGICFDDDRCILWDCGSLHGTFINEFSLPVKALLHGDHIRVGRSIFVYLLADEIDEGLLKLTPTERSWSYGYHIPDRAGSYEATKGSALAALLQLNASLHAIRSADEIQARALESIFQVIPAERAAILLAGHDQNQFVFFNIPQQRPEKRRRFCPR